MQSSGYHSQSIKPSHFPHAAIDGAKNKVREGEDGTSLLTYPEDVGGLLKHHHKLELNHLFVGCAALCDIWLHVECLCNHILKESMLCSRITT